MHRAVLLFLISSFAASAQTEFGNSRVRVQVNRTNMTWNISWPDAGVSIPNMSFAVEINGKTLKPEHPSTVVNQEDGFADVLQSWTNRVEVYRDLRLPTAATNSAVTLSAWIINNTDHEVALGTQHLIDLYGPWQVGNSNLTPASVYIVNASELQCLPPDTVAERNYNSTGALGLFNSSSRSAFVIGFRSAKEARPDLSALFKTKEGGVRLLAHQPFLGRTLAPHSKLMLDAVYLDAGRDPYAALERYGDTVAESASERARTKATALWCSWYAHRMSMSEDLVLSNAAIAAKYFKPLGFEIMQLDHGWQKGDVTGDWLPNERFPHGLQWLAQELRNRYGFKLGVWIAPTDVAATSDTFRNHQDWMLKDEQGNPRVNWKWYWKPNPDCYELDVSNPQAAKWMEDVFSQLTSWGVSYYKIDFIASSGGEHFVRSNPRVTRGWGVLRNAIESVRKGAGPNAWIRYCQTPPLLSVGRADSTIGGTDTLDAGLNGNIDVLRTSARSLAAGYWINDRLYHREVCDMSVRMQADLEETRLRMAIMTLGGCSISFSDEFQYLPPSRIRMMQACLPPGNPPMKPLDLFERALPSIWWIHCTNSADEYEVVGLFNFENKAEERIIDLAQFGFGTNTDVLAFEYWEQKFIGLQKGSLHLTLPPQSSRIIALHKAGSRPQIIGTDLHLLQGYHELKQLDWDAKALTLSGVCERMPGISGQLFVYIPPGFTPHFDFPLSPESAALTHLQDRLWAYEIHFENARQAWHIPFDSAKN